MADILQAVVRKTDDGYLAACPYPELQCREDTLHGAIGALERAIQADRNSPDDRFYLVVSLYFGPLNIG